RTRRRAKGGQAERKRRSGPRAARSDGSDDPYSRTRGEYRSVEGLPMPSWMEPADPCAAVVQAAGRAEVSGPPAARAGGRRIAGIPNLGIPRRLDGSARLAHVYDQGLAQRSHEQEGGAEWNRRLPRSRPTQASVSRQGYRAREHRNRIGAIQVA